MKKEWYFSKNYLLNFRRYFWSRPGIYTKIPQTGWYFRHDIQMRALVRSTLMGSNIWRVSMGKRRGKDRGSNSNKSAAKFQQILKIELQQSMASWNVKCYLILGNIFKREWNCAVVSQTKTQLLKKIIFFQSFQSHRYSITALLNKVFLDKIKYVLFYCQIVHIWET